MGGRPQGLRRDIGVYRPGESPADVDWAFKQLAKALADLPPRSLIADDVAVVAYALARQAIQQAMTECDRRLDDLGFPRSATYLAGMEIVKEAAPNG